jgi:propionate CoA-transferase
VFTGTFTAGGLQVAAEDGRLRVVREGRSRKFVEAVEQVTFSGAYAAERGRSSSTSPSAASSAAPPRAWNSSRWRPGIDLERDILAHMDFRPIVRDPETDGPAHLPAGADGPRPDALRPGPGRRIAFDPARDTLFLNFEGMRVRSAHDVRRVRDAVEARCAEIGHRVAAVVNYDNFRIAEDVVDAYAEMVRHLEAHRYTQVSRYTSSAFLRMKLGDALERVGVRPHLFENASELGAGSADG